MCFLKNYSGDGFYGLTNFFKGITHTTLSQTVPVSTTGNERTRMSAAFCASANGFFKFFHLVSCVEITNAFLDRKKTTGVAFGSTVKRIVRLCST